MPRLFCFDYIKPRLKKRGFLLSVIRIFNQLMPPLTTRNTLPDFATIAGSLEPDCRVNSLAMTDNALLVVHPFQQMVGETTRRYNDICLTVFTNPKPCLTTQPSLVSPILILNSHGVSPCETKPYPQNRHRLCCPKADQARIKDQSLRQ